MLSNRAIKVAFGLLSSGGTRPPEDWQRAVVEGEPSPQAATAAVWKATLDDVPDADLLDAVRAYLRTPGSTWWPTPGRLRQLAPKREARQIAASVDYPAAYCALTDDEREVILRLADGDDAAWGLDVDELIRWLDEKAEVRA
jgi:hypothetical protein